MVAEKQYAERARRISTLSRSDAIHAGGGYQPVKQTSNPLPEHPRIYERDHVHSRSWNVETGHCDDSSPPMQQNDYQYYQMNEVYPQERQYIPTINEPQVHLGVRQFHRQTPVAAACQSLWAAKGHLEELHALGISDPSSASTSFESNTDNSPAAGSGESKAREGGADKKRLQYKSSDRFGRRVAVHSPETPQSRRSSHNSDISRELRDIFTRRGSQQVDSWKTSMSTALGDRRSSIMEPDSRRQSMIDGGDSRRRSRDLSDFNRDRRRCSRDLFYNRDLVSQQRGSDERRGTESRRTSRDLLDNRRQSCDSFNDNDEHDDSRRSLNQRRDSNIRRLSQDILDIEAHRDARQQRRSSRDVFYGIQSRRFSRDLPTRPMILDGQDGYTRRESRAGEGRRVSRGEFSRREVRVGDMEPLFEANEQHQRHRRRSSYIRHVAVSHDANFWRRNESPKPRDSRSLFLRRKFLSTAAVSSLDSTNSTESSAPEAIFASSVDSAGSDLEHRRLSLMNRIPTGSAPQIMSRPIATVNHSQNTQQRRRLQNRDYSVDAQSDTLFREWSRVDPAYEERGAPREHGDQRRRLDRGVSEDHSSLRPGRQRAYSRQLTANPGSNVMVPFICYPDEANCSR